MRKLNVCQDCFYYSRGDYSDYCEYPENIKIKETYRGKMQNYLRTPEKINTGMDCCWYKKGDFSTKLKSLFMLHWI